MNHADIQNHMADYLEGDLPLSKRALLDAHLDECEACARELSEMRTVIALLRRLPDPEPPSDLADNVMRRIRAGEGQQTWLDRLRAAADFMISPPVLAPVSVAMLALGILLATGQIRVMVPFGGGSALERGIVLVTPGSTSEGAPQRLAGSSKPAHPRSIGASAAEEPGDRSRSRQSAGPATRFVLLPQPHTFLRAGSSENDAVELDALAELLQARQPVLRPPLARPLQTVQVSSNRQQRGADRGIGHLGLSQRVGSAAVSADSGLPSSDEWLILVQRNPVAFADKLAGLTLAEQELWVDHLARRAVEQGSLDEVISALRRSTSQRAHLLADDFVAVGSRAVAEAGTVSREDSSGRPD